MHRQNSGRVVERAALDDTRVCSLNLLSNVIYLGTLHAAQDADRQHSTINEPIAMNNMAFAYLLGLITLSAWLAVLTGTWIINQDRTLQPQRPLSLSCDSILFLFFISPVCQVSLSEQSFSMF